MNKSLKVGILLYLFIILIGCDLLQKNTEIAFSEEIFESRVYNVQVNELGAVTNLYCPVVIDRPFKGTEESIAKLTILNNSGFDIAIYPNIRYGIDSVFFSGNSSLNIDNLEEGSFSFNFDNYEVALVEKMSNILFELQIYNYENSSYVGNIYISPKFQAPNRIAKNKNYIWYCLIFILLLFIMFFFRKFRVKERVDLSEFSFFEAISNFGNLKNEISGILTQNEFLVNSNLELKNENEYLKVEFSALEKQFENQLSRSDKRHEGLVGLVEENVNMRENEKRHKEEKDKLYSKIDSLNRNAIKSNEDYSSLIEVLSKILFLDVRKAQNVSSLIKVLKKSNEYRDLSIVDSWTQELSSGKKIEDIISDMISSEVVKDDNVRDDLRLLHYQIVEYTKEKSLGRTYEDKERNRIVSAVIQIITNLKRSIKV